MKTIIVYRWNSNSERAVIRNLEQMGYRVIVPDRQIGDYHADAAFAKELMECIHGQKPVAVFSYDYFPIISSVCEIVRLPYVSWIYDCPLYTLNSATIRNSCNHIYCFDAVYTQRLKVRGAANCVHLPLGVDEREFADVLEGAFDGQKQRYACDASFVGSLYNDSHNRLRRLLKDPQTAPYLRGYLDGLITAQQNVYGYHFVEQVLDEAAVAGIAAGCELSLGQLYEYTPRELVVSAIDKEITAREREAVLLKAAEVCETQLYTGSALSAELKASSQLCPRGYADNQTEMPLIFHESRINLNVTSRSIESGIPLRILDVLSCGGFCITNYQPEAAELLIDGEELVMYTDMEDLQAKLRYYLAHDEEREQIAQNGRRAVRERFALADRLRVMLDGISQAG